jgi:hypothetical protein
MSSFPRKRRALEAAPDDNDDFPLTRRSKVSATTTLLESNELESLRAELEHERSLRQIDQRRAQQVKSRLERQLQFASEEAEEAKQLLEEVRISSEGHMDTLRARRQEALLELRECQGQLAELEELESQEHEHAATQERVGQLEGQLEARSEEVASLRQKLEENIAEERAKSAQQQNQHEQDESVAGQSSLAPKAVLRELNRHRIALAESERKYRQLRRKTEDWQHKAQQYVQQKETATSAKMRVSKLELQTQEMRKEVEYLSANNERWEDFAKELGQTLKLTTSGGGPPEIAAVMRYLQKQAGHTKMIEAENATFERELTKAVDRVHAVEKQARDSTVATTRAQRDQATAEKTLSDANQQIQTLRAQEQIWQREADSLRSLAKTFDAILPGQKLPAVSAATKSMESALATARDEVKVIKQERDRLIKEVGDTAVGKQSLEKEHDRVLDKFTKLRDALMVERAKAEKADDRAIHAETLAGKGQFNPEGTRALHLEKNPLSDAIRERYQTEINALKKQLEKGISGTTPTRVHAQATTPTTASAEVDPEKLHKRLKDTFKEQIGIFREGVYLITGYKVDMLLDKSTPYFKVRSVYGEREEDVLVFNWPKGVKQPKSLDLRGTDFANVLSKTDAYQYLTKFDSMPGFMASTQLSLLEKCTFVSATNN